jgi:hypothetical protein
MQGMLRSGLFAAAFSVYSLAAFAVPDELQVYGDDLGEPGVTSLDVFTTYVLCGPREQGDDGFKPDDHVLRVSPEISYGLTDQLEAGVQLYTSLAPGGSAYVDGLRRAGVHPQARCGPALVLGRACGSGSSAALHLARRS